MAWPKGKPRHPATGRRKGTKNKHTLLVEALFAAYEFNPIERMIQLCNSSAVPLEIKAMLLKELAQYGWPKRKAVEHSGGGGGPLEIRVVWDDASGDNESEPLPDEPA
jgi:hypothetical protein